MRAAADGCGTSSTSRRNRYDFFYDVGMAAGVSVAVMVSVLVAVGPAQLRGRWWKVASRLGADQGGP